MDPDGRSHLLAMAMGAGMLSTGVGSYVMLRNPPVSQCYAAGAAGVVLFLSGFMIGHTNRERGFQIAAGTTMVTAASMGAQLPSSFPNPRDMLAVTKALKTKGVRTQLAVAGTNLLAGVYYTNKVLYGQLAPVPAPNRRARQHSSVDEHNQPPHTSFTAAADPYRGSSSSSSFNPKL